MEEKKSVFDGLDKTYSELLAEGIKNAKFPKEQPKVAEVPVVYVDDADAEELEEE